MEWAAPEWSSILQSWMGREVEHNCSGPVASLLKADAIVQPGASVVLAHTPGDEDVDICWKDASCGTRVCASQRMESEGGARGWSQMVQTEGGD